MKARHDRGWPPLARYTDNVRQTNETGSWQHTVDGGWMWGYFPGVFHHVGSIDRGWTIVGSGKKTLERR